MTWKPRTPLPDTFSFFTHNIKGVFYWFLLVVSASWGWIKLVSTNSWKRQSFQYSWTNDQGSLLTPKMEFFIKLIFEVRAFYKYAKLSFLLKEVVFYKKCAFSWNSSFFEGKRFLVSWNSSFFEGKRPLVSWNLSFFEGKRPLVEIDQLPNLLHLSFL